MNGIVSGGRDSLPQALLIVLGGTAGELEQWIDGRGQPDMHVEMFFPA
jgi:hypothetical protein